MMVVDDKKAGKEPGERKDLMPEVQIRIVGCRSGSAAFDESGDGAMNGLRCGCGSARV